MLNTNGKDVLKTGLCKECGHGVALILYGTAAVPTVVHTDEHRPKDKFECKICGCYKPKFADDVFCKKCGSKKREVKAVILDNNALSIACYLEERCDECGQIPDKQGEINDKKDGNSGI